jgi:hypothetical protein
MPQGIIPKNPWIIHSAPGSPLTLRPSEALEDAREHLAQVRQTMAAGASNAACREICVATMPQT